MPVIEPVAVANIEALLAAISPDRVLHEPRKHLRECAVELPGINLIGNRPNDVGAAAWPVTAWAVAMGGIKPIQDPSAERYSTAAWKSPVILRGSGTDQRESENDAAA